MSIKSVFEFNFPDEAREEGLAACLAIGQDMVFLSGYLDHEVVQDVKAPGHLMVNTLWKDQAASDAVLSRYQHDEKIKRATKLMDAPPKGFVGQVLPKSS